MLEEQKESRIVYDIPVAGLSEENIIVKSGEDRRRAYGIDFSKYAEDFIYPDDAPIPIDFAVQRTSYWLRIDERYDNHSKRMNNVPVRMAYHYYHMEVPWKQQVDLFLELTLNNPHTDYHQIWWDAEEDQWGNQIGRRFCNEVAESVRYLHMDFPGAGIYCNLDCYVQMQYWVDSGWLANIPLWLAAPRHDEPIKKMVDGELDPGWGVWRGTNPNYYFVPVKRPEGSWDLWQISFRGDPEEHGIIGKNAVDVNVYNGSPDELLEHFGLVIHNKRMIDPVSKIRYRAELLGRRIFGHSSNRQQPLRIAM